MGRCIVKLAENKYVEWSTIVDAPVTYVLTRKDMKKYLDEEYGRSSLEENEERLKRTDKNGTSWHTPESAEDFVEYNRAGPKERCIPLAEIIKRFTYKEKKRGKK